jgi:hypothetical protein
MNNRKRRQQELEAKLKSRFGSQSVVELYRTKVVGQGKVGESGITTSQMIPLILDAEFSGRK